MSDEETDVEFQVVLPEQAALTVAEMLAEREALKAERNRLRTVVEFERGRADGYLWERDRFRDECLRLRAVVDAAHELLDEDRTSWSDEHARLADVLAALDVSGEATDG